MVTTLRYARLLASCVCGALLSGSRTHDARTHATSDTHGTRDAQTFGKIRGVVFDSLLMHPAAHAKVTLLSTSRTTTTDDKGRYSFDTVPVGEQIVSISTPELDSLGFGTLGTSAVIASATTATVNVATPSLRTVWMRRCSGGSVIGSDSSVVWGTVRDATTGNAVGGAVTTFYWYDLGHGGLATLFALSGKGETKVIEANGDGEYFACGVPHDVTIATDARTDSAASGRVQYTVGERHMHRLDLFISGDMVVHDTLGLTVSDSTDFDRARGHSTVEGVITDDKRRPLVDAVVFVTSIDTTVRTNSAGRFRLGGLPGGTHMLQVRSVGASPATQLVQLRANQTTSVAVAMSPLNALAVFNVVGQSVRRAQYEERREKHIGVAIDSTVLEHRADFYSTMRMFPELITKMHPEGQGLSICCSVIYLDGMPAPMTMVTAIPPDHFRAIEVIPMLQAPAEFYDPHIPILILLWSKNVKW